MHKSIWPNTNTPVQGGDMLGMYHYYVLSSGYLEPLAQKMTRCMPAV